MRAQMRRDPVMGRWVIVAPERATRPGSTRPLARLVSDEECPFCEGREDQTPLEILADREPDTAADGPGWRVRVIPNRYRALHREGEPHALGDGLFHALDGVGIHDLILDSPRHVVSLTEEPVGQTRRLLRMFRQRLRELHDDPRLAYAMLFKNVGAAAGASVEHSHSQILATPVVPMGVREELDGAADYHRRHGECVFCASEQHERGSGERLVLANEHATAFCPFAARVPFETWLLSRQHRPHFEDARDVELDAFAEVLHETLRRIEVSVGQPAYNVLLHTAPLHEDAPTFHWHFEIVPRTTTAAGFEWGTGMLINPLPPEWAAARLREV